MSLRLGSFLFGMFLLVNFDSSIIAQDNLAQILVDKSMAKLIKPEIRRNLRIDIETTTEKFDTGNAGRHR